MFGEAIWPVQVYYLWYNRGIWRISADETRDSEKMLSMHGHQMERFSVLLALCAGNSPVTGEFPAQRPVTQSFDVFFDLQRCYLCMGIKWKHFRGHWPFVRGIHRSPVNSPHKGQWHRALMFSLICAWINGWVKNHEAGDLRCHCTHHDVTVMWCNRGRCGISLDETMDSQKRLFVLPSPASYGVSFVDMFEELQYYNRI